MPRYGIRGPYHDYCLERQSMLLLPSEAGVWIASWHAWSAVKCFTLQHKETRSRQTTRVTERSSLPIFSRMAENSFLAPSKPAGHCILSSTSTTWPIRRLHWLTTSMHTSHFRQRHAEGWQHVLNPVILSWIVGTVLNKHWLACLDMSPMPKVNLEAGDGTARSVTDTVRPILVNCPARKRRILVFRIGREILLLMA